MYVNTIIMKPQWCIMVKTQLLKLVRINLVLSLPPILHDSSQGGWHLRVEPPSPNDRCILNRAKWLLGDGDKNLTLLCIKLRYAYST